MRHWFRSRAAFTRPNFGTAINMSNTFAVETYSGGSRRIDSIWTRPSFRSLLSCARRTRMSFARWRASIRWSSERAGAWACVFDVTIERTSLASCGRESRGTVGSDLQGFFKLGNSDRAGVGRVLEPTGGSLGPELVPQAGGRERVREEDR